MGDDDIRKLSLATLAFCGATALLPIVLSTADFHTVAAEDGPIEWIGALSFLGAALFFGRAWLRSRTHLAFGPVRPSRSPWLLLLALAFVFAAGEEISWGQRLFDFDTPGVLDDNVQEETTIHNLPLFDPTNTDSLFHMNRLFTYFWFGFGVVVPIAARFTGADRWIERSGLPVVPLALGLLFPLFFVVSKLYPSIGIHDADTEGGLVELRETQHAVIFLAIALAFALRSSRSEAELDAPRDAAGAAS